MSLWEHMFRTILRACEDHKDVKVIYLIHMNSVVREVANRFFGNNNRIGVYRAME